MDGLISVLGFIIILVILGLYIYSMYLNVQMDWKRSILMQELDKLQTQKEILMSKNEVLVQKTVKAISENEELQALLINLEKTSYNQKLAMILATLLTITVITVTLYGLVNLCTTSLDVPASVSNVVDVSQIGVTSTMDAQIQTLKAINDLQVQIAESNAHIHSLILASETLTNEIAIISSKITVSQSQPLLGISTDTFNAINSVGGAFGVF